MFFKIFIQWYYSVIYFICKQVYAIIYIKWEEVQRMPNYKKVLQQDSNDKSCSKMTKKEKRIRRKMENSIGKVLDHRSPISNEKPFSFSYNPVNKRKTVNTKNKRKNNCPIDYNNPISTYKSREIEYGHGRAKSKEWNDEEAKKLRLDIEKMSSIKRTDPNTLDRFAMK